ncbi:glycoside hydrolase family 43 protein [Microbacterium testaceum]|uniref:glycoside hydrolase family 43 protein n=1 Tax=Microbacterium testaceum TaxID=2033 RepID=UPI001D176BE9|nr:glycoside hydrolase family 43 protein [Microbacterium testaceum]MCC4247819.1 glycoside hydrolase family 43 protein [Microbacterium testaceum]
MVRDAATTPVIPGFFPDPSVCRVGEDYYLVNSSFEYAPGIPIWHSRDLRTWTQLGNVLTRESQFPAGVSAASRGIYAPTIRHRDGLFFVVGTNVDRGGEQFVVTATDPAGPWSDPIVFPGLGGIDPDLAWDDDGSCHLTYCALDEALRPEDGSLPVIAQARIDLERDILLEEPRVIWRGSGLAHPEGPHLYRHDGWWYLLTAEGGTERGHAVCVARSRAIDGPFDSAPTNPIFSRRSTGFPVQNTGHADLVERCDGDWAMVYLGVRPRGFTPGFHVVGRETFLARIAWVDDWPVVHTDDVLPDRADTAFVDDFSAAELHPRWVSPHGVLPGPHPAGGVALGPDDLAVRVRDLRWRFEAPVDATAAVALRVRLDDHHWYEITLDGTAAEVRARIGPLEASVGSARATGDVVTLLVEAVDATHDGPDDLRFGLIDADGERWIAALDGRYLSTEVAGGFTGRTLGLRALGPTPVRVGGVRYTPLGSE